MVFLVGIATFCATLLGGVFALKLRDSLHLVLGFSAGAVLGVAFFDLLPESLALSTAGPETTLAVAALGFGLYLLLDRSIILHHHHEEHDHRHEPSSRGVWGASTLSFHSFLDGLAIGLAFQASSAVGLVVAAAVLAHDFSDGINTVGIIVRHGGDRRSAFRWLALDAVAPVVGILVASLIVLPSGALGLLLALFGGFFLYIGAAELLPESHHEHPVFWTTFATLVGMAVMYIVIGAAGA